MVNEGRYLPQAVRLEIEKIRNSRKKITDIESHVYVRYIEVHVNGVDERGWAFCKVITYPLKENNE